MRNINLSKSVDDPNLTTDEKAFIEKLYHIDNVLNAARAELRNKFPEKFTTNEQLSEKMRKESK